MARRGALESFIRAAARSAAASERERQRSIRAQASNARQLERAERMARTLSDRQLREADKQAKQQYLEDREAEAKDLCSDLDLRLADLAGILTHTLAVDDRISFGSLKPDTAFDDFVPPQELAPARPPTKREPIPITGLARFFPGSKAKQEREATEVDAYNRSALEQFQRDELTKRDKFAALKAEHESRKAAHGAGVTKRSAEIDEFEAAYRNREPEAVVAYVEMVLTRSEYPADGFPQIYRVAYAIDSSELAIEYDLPKASVVPVEAEFRFVKSKDVIESKPRKATDIKRLYQDVVAAITLRTLHEVFESDQGDAINVATFTGIIDTVDPASGHEIRVPVISVRVTKADFVAIRLDKVDKAACLKNLGAHVSSRPDELQAVKPIIEFDMIDRRFVDQGDALSGLEARPNLLEMTPTEFEVLVANLFGRMGLETKLTRASRDGGVDAVAFDLRPVLGGKVVIQAKRYRDTVGVSAVRDLYGTMMNEGANKGILVCTSGYGSDAYNFVKDKPIELIDGGGLLYLLREHASVHARITS